MIRHVKNKLRDEGGVTILMALFALLVAAMVSVVILNAATTAVHQAKSDHEFEQASLSLQSAAQMVVEELYDANGLNNLKIQYSETTVTETGKSPSISTSGPSVGEGSSIIQGELVASVGELLSNPAQDVQGKAFAISASAANDESLDYHQVVQGSYVLRNGMHDETETGLNYQLIFTFTLEDGSSDPQTLYVKLQGMCSSNTNTDKQTSGGIEKVTTTNTYTYSWSEPRFYTAEEGN